ncbi:MAG TPA: sensor histidine kinase [Streptosporangiaceae bacterium]
MSPNAAARRVRQWLATGPWRPARVRHNVAFVLVSLPLQAAGLVLLFVSSVAGLEVLHHGLVPGTGQLGKGSVIAGGAVVGVVVVAAATRPLTSLQRRRMRRLQGVSIPAVRAGEPLTWRELASSARSVTAMRKLAREAAAASRWAFIGRQLLYHLLAAPVAGICGLAAIGTGIGGLALACIYLYARVLRGTYERTHSWELAALTVAGFLLLLVMPWLLAGVTRLDTVAAVALLGPDRAGTLARRVEVLTQSRAGVVDAADAERRRIERDLHDGAQQRLVSLAMNLGIARVGLTQVPDEARKVIEDAHEEAKAALSELRDLVRGLHPAILEDRGLDAALSGVAARAPFPVRLRVEVAVRPSPTVEAIAYFVVSEALANATKHAHASRAEVAVGRTGDILRVSVTDDGVGGADQALGTGLAGLARRAGSVDGTFSLTSPAGGPTEIVVELPCAP